MRRKDFNNIVFTGMAGILALVFILTALMPYGILKQLANSLMSDGNFDSLKEQNAPIFKILLGITGLLFLSTAKIAALNFEAGICTCDILTICAFLILVNISAIGSIIIIFPLLLPRCFSYAWNFTKGRFFSKTYST